MTTTSKIITSVTCAVVVGCLAWYYSPLQDRTSSTGTTQITSNRPFEDIIEITTNWSTSVKVFGGFNTPQRKLDFYVHEDNVPYIVEYNGGKNKGGWEDPPIPAIKDCPPDWKPMFHPGIVESVRFRIAPNSKVDKAHLTYTISVK